MRRSGIEPGNLRFSRHAGRGLDFPLPIGLMHFDPSAFTGFGPILPFTLNVSKDFEYPYAIQGNLGIERMIGKNMSVSATFITNNGQHLHILKM